MRRYLALVAALATALALLGSPTQLSAQTPEPESRLHGETITISAGNGARFHTQQSYNGPVMITISGSVRTNHVNPDGSWWWHNTDPTYTYQGCGGGQGDPDGACDAPLGHPADMVWMIMGDLDDPSSNPYRISLWWSSGVAYNPAHSYSVVYNNQADNRWYGHLGFELDADLWDPNAAAPGQAGTTTFSGGFTVTVTPLKYPERDALIRIYDSTNGPNWTNSSGWLTSPNVCNWYGLKCDGTGRVFALGTSQYNLSGTLPASFAGLENLTDLDLEGQLTGPLPSLSGLTRLELLKIIHTGISGPLPNLSNAPNLRSVELFSNKFSGPLANLVGGNPAAFSNLGSLQVLNVKENALTGAIPAGLGSITNLRELDLSWNQFSATSLPSDLGSLANSLTSLYLEGNADLAGSLPESYLSLSLTSFEFFGTRICVPPTPQFDAWLQTIGHLQGTGTQCGADVSVTKSALSESAIVGRPLSYRITVKNLTTREVRDVAMKDTLPANAVYQSHLAPQGASCTAPAVGSAGTISCTITQLAANASVDFTVVVKPSDVQNGKIANKADVTVPIGDPNTANNAATSEIPLCELSGLQWVQRYRGSKSVDDLAEPFRSNVKSFIHALDDAHASYSIGSTRRPPERQYLMRYSFLVAKGDIDPRDVPTYPGVPICWAHPDASGQFDRVASVKAAKDMVSRSGYNIVYQPGVTSNHVQGLAIDMTISWEGRLTITDGDGKTLTIIGGPRTEMNKTLWDVAATYHVIKNRKDRPHWSANGR